MALRKISGSGREMKLRICERAAPPAEDVMLVVAAFPVGIDRNKVDVRCDTRRDDDPFFDTRRVVQAAAENIFQRCLLLLVNTKVNMT